MTAVKKACRDVGVTLPNVKDYFLIVVRVTVIPGTRRLFGHQLELYSNKKVGGEFGLAMQPEFLREGSAIKTSDEVSGIFWPANGLKHRLSSVWHNLMERVVPGLKG